MRSSQRRFSVVGLGTTTFSLAVAPNSQSTSSSNYYLEDVVGVAGIIGLAAFGLVGMMEEGSEGVARTIPAESTERDEVLRVANNQRVLTLNDFRTAIVAHPTARRFVIGEDGTIQQREPDPATGGRNRSENMAITSALKDAITREHSPAITEGFFPRNNGLIINPADVSGARLCAIFSGIDLHLSQETKKEIGAKEEEKHDELSNPDLADVSGDVIIYPKIQDLKEKDTPLLFATFKEARDKNPQAKRFILNEKKDKIHPSEEMQSSSKTRAENRIIKSELKKITPCHADMEEKVFQKIDHPLTPEALKTILYLREPLSFEQIRSLPSTQLDELYSLETLVAENGLANLIESFGPTSYSKGVQAEIEELYDKDCFQTLQSVKYFFDHKKYYLQRKEALMRHWEENNYATILPDKKQAYRKMLVAYEKIETIGVKAEIIFKKDLEQLATNKEVIDLRQEYLQRHISALRAASDRERPIHEEYIIEEMEMMRRESYHPFRFITYQSAIIETLKEAISPLKLNALDLALGSTIRDLKNKYDQQQASSVIANTKLSKITKDLDEKKLLGKQSVADVEHLARANFLGEKEIRDKTEKALSQLRNIEALDLAIKSISAEQLMLEWAHLILTTAEKTKGTFNILKIVNGYKGPTAVSRAISEYLGKLWVGPNPTPNPSGWKSQDGLKRYRFITLKYQGLGSRADTGLQSNFDWRADKTVDWNLSPGELKKQNANWGDGHLDILH